jgi:osmoprotectant transport system ATP-binding protein
MSAATGSGRAATVRYDHVTKSYGAAAAAKGAAAVNDFSLEVPAGKICVLVGPSGCGKTTSLKMVNRLIEPTRGQILIDGVDIATRDITDLRRGIGYVIQHVGLFPHLTIEQNVATVTRLLGWPAARQKERADELLTTVGLDPARYARRYPAQLSGGERQRVGVARALAADPPIMLMDEPFGAVDPIVRERLQNEFLRLQEQLAKTILFVTHDIDEAIKMGDLVVVMRTGGQIAQFATPAEILARPASDFVARFVGTDRGLKRLALYRIGQVPLRSAVTVRPGDDAADARRRAAESHLRHVLVIDQAGAPTGWLSVTDLPSAGNVTTEHMTALSPLFDRRTTLKDAFSMLLDETVQAGIVTDRHGVVRGIVTVEDLIEWARTSADVEPAPPDPADFVVEPEPGAGAA